jgi:hypothetical protein
MHGSAGARVHVEAPQCATGSTRAMGYIEQSRDGEHAGCQFSTRVARIILDIARKPERGLG